METVKGFKDYDGEEALKRAKIREIVVGTFEEFGFEPAETPVIEDEEFVKGDNEKDEAVSDVYRLGDKGGRKLALRYEFTFQLKRLAKNKKLPYRRYQIGVVFRDEPATGNRSRQFVSCDVDVIGASVKNEAEVLSAASVLLKKLGIKGIIYVNNRKLINEILDSEGVKDKGAVIREIDKLDKISEKEVKANLKKYGAESVVGIFKKPESYFKKYESYNEIEELKKYCGYFGVKVEFLPSLARGLSYYNGTIFEIKVGGIRETIFGGGAYNFNNVQGFGFGVSLERLSIVAKIKIENESVLVISIDKDKEAIKLASDLRGKGVGCFVYYGKSGKGLDYANAKKMKYVVFVGEREVKSGKFTLKDLNSGKEFKVDVKEIVKKLS